MKKKLGIIFLTGILSVVLLAGCGADQEEQSSSGSASEQSTSEASKEKSTSSSSKANLAVNPEDVAKKLESQENPKFDKEDIRGISVVVDGEPVYQMNYTPRDDRESYLYWDMVTPYASTAVVDTEAMYELYEMIAGMDLTSGSEEAKDSAQAMENCDTYITLNYYEHKDSEEQKEEPNRTATLLIGEQKDGKYYCELKEYGEKGLWISADTIDAILQQESYDLILKIPYVVNVTTVKKVNISYKGKDYTMTSDNGTYKINGKKVDASEYQSLYSELMQPMLDGEIEEDFGPEKGREPLISIRYIRNMDGAEDYEVNIYSCGDDQYTVSVNGEENFFLVAEDVKTLEKALQDAF